MNILNKWLQKMGIEKEEEMTEDEVKTYEEYKRILSADPLTIESIKEFCQYQISIIEGKWKDLEYEGKEKLIPYHTVYKALLGAINRPKVEREQLEKYLNSLL